jgi:long-subunit fatty acid transport protein
MASTLGACVSAWCAGAAASPQEVLGFGYRSMGMGNTGVAVGQGVDTVYANPALLSLSRDVGLQLGTMGHQFGLTAEGASIGALPDYPSLSASSIGGLLPLPFGGVLADRITIGLGFLTPYDVVVRGRILYPEKPQYLIADRVQSVAVQAAIGIDIGYGLRIGGGVAALAALDGSVIVQTDASGRIGTVVEDTLVASFAPLAGASFDIGDDWRIGAAFRGELQARFNVIIEANNLGQLNIPPLNISGVAQYDPWQIALEAAHVADPIRVAVNATYKHWPAYPGAVEATVRCEDAEDPDQTCGALVPEDPDYNPVVSPRLGVDWSVPLAERATLMLRAGYAFEPSPAPEQTGRSNYLDNHRSVFSLGYGFRFAESLGPVSFDGYVQAQWLHDRSHDKSVADGAPIDGTIDTSGYIFGGGTAVAVSF